MSYYKAVREAGTRRTGECEENDYIYDAPHLSPGMPFTAEGTSYYEIERKVGARKEYDCGRNHLTPDVWEDLLLSIAA